MGNAFCPFYPFYPDYIEYLHTYLRTDMKNARNQANVSKNMIPFITLEACVSLIVDT
jgi:hypothetical protein